MPVNKKAAIRRPVALLPIGEVSRSDGGGWTYLHEKGVHNVDPFLVEMGGLEPPSNQTINMLSTCLFFLWLSGKGCRKTGYLNLIL